MGESKTGNCRKIGDENMLIKYVTKSEFYLGAKPNDSKVEFWVRVKQANVRKWGTKILQLDGNRVC